MIVQLRCSAHTDQEIIMIALNKDCEKKNRILCAECMEDRELKQLCPITKLQVRTREYQTRRSKELQELSLTEQQKLENAIKLIVTLKDKSDQIFVSLISECQQLQQWLKQQLMEQLSYYEGFFNNLTKNKLEELAEMLSGVKERSYCYESLPKKYNELTALIQAKSRQIENDFSDISRIFQKENNQSQISQRKQLKLIGESQDIVFNSVVLAHNHKKSLLFVGQLDFIQIWKLDGINLKKSIPLTGHIGQVTALAIYKSGDVLISGGADKSLKLWQITEKDSNCFQTLYDHNGEIKEIKFTPKDDQVLSASSDRTIKVWIKGEFNNLKLLQTISESSDPVYNFASSETYLAASTTWAWKCYIDVLKLESGRWKVVETKRTDVRMQALCFSNNQDLICQQHDPAKILIYIINYKDNLELKQEISLKQFQFDYCGAFPIISLDCRFFLKNFNSLVVLSQTGAYNYVIEQVIDKSFSCGCVDAIGSYIHLVNENEKKLEIYNIY